MDKRNPYKICIWQDPSGCGKCSNAGKINCRFDAGLMRIFLVPSLSFLFFSFAGLIIIAVTSRMWWTAAGYAVFLFLFFLVIETRILCSHCPYYSEESRILHCSANYGLFKIWPYNPRPMNFLEKTVLIVSFIIFGGFPIAAQILGLWSMYISTGNYNAPFFILTAALVLTILAGAALLAVLAKFFCPRCINFSCPFNRVSRDTAGEFLKKNPFILKRWERH